MPHQKLSRMSGMPQETVHSPYDHNPRHEAKCAGMNDHEMRRFMREEQAEGTHPSLKGKHF